MVRTMLAMAELFGHSLGSERLGGFELMSCQPQDSN